MATKQIPVLVCDITGKEIKEGADRYSDVTIGDKTYADVSAEAIEKIQAFVKKLGEPRKPRKPQATI